MKLRQARDEDAEAIYRIMKQVHRELADKSLFVCDDLAFVKAHISESGFGVVACDDSGQIVGSFLFRYPGEAADNLGRDIGLPEQELCRVVHMESAVVLPQYRGRHLQSQMLQYGEQLIDKSRYIYFMTTVSPDNPASYLTFERAGYRIAATKEKYGGYLRRIYCKRL